MDKYIELYIALREKKAEVRQRHKEELEPIEAGLMKLESLMAQALESAGISKAGSKAGTAFFKENTSVSVDDWSAVVQYVQDNDAFDILERRVAKSAVLERGDVPGILKVTSKVVQVRKA